MEDEDGVEGAEFGADDAEVQPDDHGVEYDAEFEDQEGGDLLLECEAAGFGVAEFDFLGETFFVIVFRGRRVRCWYAMRTIRFVPVFDARDGGLDVLLRAHVVFDLHEALGSKVQ